MAVDNWSAAGRQSAGEEGWRSVAGGAAVRWKLEVGSGKWEVGSWKASGGCQSPGKSHAEILSRTLPAGGVSFQC